MKFHKEAPDPFKPAISPQGFSTIQGIFSIKMKVGYHALNSQKPSISASSPVYTPKGEKDEWPT